MAKADHHKGLTVEGDEFPPRLTIDGRLVEGVAFDQGECIVSEHPEVRGKTLFQLGQQIIERSNQLTTDRETIRNDHLNKLKNGVQQWNDWRRENPAIRPLLLEADLRKEALKLGDLRSVDFANANLIRSDLRNMDLTGANFHEANLGGADLSHACLTGANFSPYHSG